MKKTYDVFDNGLGQLNSDIEKLKNDLIWANQVAVASLEPLIMSTIHFNGNMNTNMDNWSAVVNFNKFKFVRNKYKPHIIVRNENEQTTYAEYGYGIIGMRNPLMVKAQIFGDVGYKGYDLPSRYKKPDHSWWYKKFGVTHHTYGEKPVPTFYRTYLYFDRNLAKIIGQKLEKVMNKL